MYCNEIEKIYNLATLLLSNTLQNYYYLKVHPQFDFLLGSFQLQHFNCNISIATASSFVQLLYVVFIISSDKVLNSCSSIK